MQYKLLVSDFDNTLVPFGEPKPRPAVVKAVKKLQAAGVKFALSTGRAYPCVHREQLGGIRPDYIVTCNGACVTDSKGTVVTEHPLTNEEMYALVDFCEDYNYPLQFNFRDACYVYCEYEALRNNYAKMGSSGLTCVDGEDQDRHLIDMPHAAFAAVPPEHVADFMKKYGHLNLNWMQVGAKNADGYGFYDIVRGGMDKGVGLTDLCARLDLPPIMSKSELILQFPMPGFPTQNLLQVQLQQSILSRYHKRERLNCLLVLNLHHLEKLPL